MTIKSTRRVVGHSLVHSLVRSHRSLIHLLRTAHSAALIRLLARLLTHTGAHGKEVFVYETNASISYSFNPLCIRAKFFLANFSLHYFESCFFFLASNIRQGEAEKRRIKKRRPQRRSRYVSTIPFFYFFFSLFSSFFSLFYFLLLFFPLVLFPFFYFLCQLKTKNRISFRALIGYSSKPKKNARFYFFLLFFLFSFIFFFFLH